VLREILERVSEGGSWTTEGLARELDSTPEHVVAMLEELVRRGYLKPVGDSCAGACASCSIGETCSVGSPRVWTLNRNG
jgi:hypothetical protein